MKNITIRNFKGLRDLSAEWGQNLLVMGRNGAGKSSLAEGVRRALSHTPIPQNQTGQYLTVGADTPFSVDVGLDGANANLTKKGAAGGGSRTADPYAVGLLLASQSSASQIVAHLTQITGVRIIDWVERYCADIPGGDEVQRAIQRHFSERNQWDAESLSNHSVWDKAAEHFGEEVKAGKRSWTEVSGVPYGCNVAANWHPPDFDYQIGRHSLDELRVMLDGLRQTDTKRTGKIEELRKQRDDLKREADALREADRTGEMEAELNGVRQRLQEAAEALREEEQELFALTNQMEKAESTARKWQESRNKLRDAQQDVVAQQTRATEIAAEAMADIRKRHKARADFCDRAVKGGNKWVQSRVAGYMDGEPADVIASWGAGAQEEMDSLAEVLLEFYEWHDRAGQQLNASIAELRSEANHTNLTCPSCSAGLQLRDGNLVEDQFSGNPAEAAEKLRQALESQAALKEAQSRVSKWGRSLGEATDRWKSAQRVIDAMKTLAPPEAMESPDLAERKDRQSGVVRQMKHDHSVIAAEADVLEKNLLAAQKTRQSVDSKTELAAQMDSRIDELLAQPAAQEFPLDEEQARLGIAQAERVQKAETLHQQIEAAQRVRSALEASGVRGLAFSHVTQQFHAVSSVVFGLFWHERDCLVEIHQTDGIRLNGVSVKQMSESERWVVDLCYQLTAAIITNSPAVVVDRLDVLDRQNLRGGGDVPLLQSIEDALEAGQSRHPAIIVCATDNGAIDEYLLGANWSVLQL